MYTLQQWIDAHAKAYAWPDDGAPAQGLMRELLEVERRVQELDVLGSLAVVGHYGLTRCGPCDFTRDYELPVLAISLPKRGLRLYAADHELVRNGRKTGSFTVEAELPVNGLVEALEKIRASKSSIVVGMHDVFMERNQSWFKSLWAVNAPVHGPYRLDRRRFSFQTVGFAGVTEILELLIDLSSP